MFIKCPEVFLVIVPGYQPVAEPWTKAVMGVGTLSLTLLLPGANTESNNIEGWLPLIFLSG